MTGDFTRDTFDPAKGYTAVRMQQGRLFTDADWNEQGDIARFAERFSTRAVIGASGFPENAPGFEVVAGPGGALLVGPGTAFVDGIDVENDVGALHSLRRKSGAGANTEWFVDAGLRLSVGEWLVLAGGAVAQAVRVSEIVADPGALQVVKTGAALSAAANVQVQRWFSVEKQPFAPLAVMPQAADAYLAYMQLWERPVGVIEDPGLRETAFGGPDTAGRDRLIWQVRLVRMAELVAAGAVVLPATCKSFGPGWTPFGPGARGRLAARANAAAAVVDPCVLPAAGGYRSLENHLYRAEIHRGGTLAGGQVLLKWSRDNGIHRARYGAIDAGRLVLDALGRDEAGSLKQGDWVEILDEDRVLLGKPGFFARLGDVNGKRAAIDTLLDPETMAPLTVGGVPNVAVLPAVGMVRRWEGGAPVAVVDGAWRALELGVEVQLGEGRFAVGDHWLVPARSLVADIEWPRDPATGAPALLPPKGPVMHYAALALATLGGGGWSLSDCRTLFAPLTLQRGFQYLGGDGQEAMPVPANTPALTPLGSPLRVGVVRGRTPVAGAVVEFRVVAGNGRLGAVADNLALRQVVTGADGVAEMAWAVDSATQVQRVEARLLDSAGVPTHLAMRFSASLSRASQVSFDTVNTPELAGADTVQAAIERLAQLKAAGCATYVLVPGTDWVGVLNALKPGEHAALCFQRGRFETKEMVAMKGLGHISLHGAGDGSEIVVTSGECALRFEDCASVEVRDVLISAADGGAPTPKPGLRPGRLGALTVLGTPDVDVVGASIRCGGDAVTERTCITVRGTAAAPLRSVRILSNRLTVGYAQDGILVTDCVRTVIAGNDIVVAARSRKLSFERLLATKYWRARLVERLFAGAKAGEPKSPKGRQTIRAGEFVAAFDSPVAAIEWARHLKANPVPAAAARSMATFRRAVQGILMALAADPAPLPGFKRRVDELERAGGAPLKPEVRQALLVSGEIDFSERVAAPAGRAGEVGLSSGGFAISFTSVVSEADWRNALALMPLKTVANTDDLIRHAQRLAVRMIADVKFRNQLPSARGWFVQFAKALPAYGRQAITCGGSVLGDVVVRDNLARGFVQGVHVGTSFGGRKPWLRAGQVTIAGNSLFCRKPADDAHGPCAVFLGNVDTGRIEDNLIDWATPRQKLPYIQGIRVWGDLGDFLMVARNRIGVATMGIRVKPLAVVPEKDWGRMMWLAADNLAVGVNPALVLRVPPFMEKRNNRPK